MIKGFVEEINIREEDEDNAVIRLENKKCYIVPLEMLPEGAELYDFVIIDKGVVSIDPLNDEKKYEMQKALEELIK